jgi:hypothetical protein
MIKRLLLVASILSPICAATAQPVDVDISIVLAVDASASVSNPELSLQREGYAQALTAPDVLAAIAAGPNGRIEVSYFEWGSFDDPVVGLPPAVIDGKASAQSYASKIRALQMLPFVARSLQMTSISHAMTVGLQTLESSVNRSRRSVIDISGDGANNNGDSLEATRALLLARGIVINGLPIRNNYDRTVDVVAYYKGKVIGGPGSFSLPVNSMASFGTAITAKLVAEVSGIAPRTMTADLVAAPSTNRPAKRGPTITILTAER